MSTEKQKAAMRRSTEKAREVESPRAHGEDIPYPNGLSTAEKNRLPEEKFAFPKQRKEPLVDASHVRNAVARFDQVAGVTDHQRAQAWRRIEAAARRFGVHIRADNWRQLFAGGKERRR